MFVLMLLVSVSLAAQRTFERQLPARPSGTISVEAESLAGSAQATHGKVFPQDMRSFGPGWSGNLQLFWAVAQLGAQLRLSFPTAGAGRYQVFLHFTRAPDYAQIRVSFDAAPAVSINGYAAGVSRDRALLGMLDLAPGAHELLLEVAMKDGRSTGLNVGLDRIELEPVDRGASMGMQQEQATQNAAAAAEAMAVPVLRVPAGSAPTRQSPVQALEPLPMAARIGIARRALAGTSTMSGEPGATLRLTPSAPAVPQKAALQVANATFHSDPLTDGWISLDANSKLDLVYLEVEAHRPYLLDCGMLLNKATAIRVSALVSNNVVELNKVSLAPGNQRMLAVVVPASHSMVLELERVGTPANIALSYCELTPFE